MVHVEDDLLWCEVVAKLLQVSGRCDYRGAAHGSAQGLDLCRRMQPNIIVLDLGLPDHDGYFFLDELRGLSIKARVVVLTCRKDEYTLFCSRRQDISALIWKDANVTENLTAALVAVIDGKRWLSPEVSEADRILRGSSDAFYKIISEKELVLLPHFAAGESDAKIAADYSLSKSTVHSHRQNIFAKLNLHRTHELTAWALRKGIISHLR